MAYKIKKYTIYFILQYQEFLGCYFGLILFNIISNYAINILICTVSVYYHSDMITYLLSHPLCITSPLTYSHCSCIMFFSWSPQSTSSECKAALRSDVRQRASPGRHASRPGLWLSRVNTPQGRSSKTHKARGINYSDWRRLSETDKCVLQFCSCFSLQFELEGGKTSCPLLCTLSPQMNKTPETNVIQ